MEEVQSDLDWIELKVYHGEGAAIELDSSYYELKATYESVDSDVSISLRSIIILSSLEEYSKTHLDNNL